MKDDLANEDLAHLRAATEPKDDMLKRETPLPKASPVCPVCGIAVPHAHDYAGLMTLIVKQKNDLAAAQADLREHIALCLEANKLIDNAQAERDALRERANALLHQIDIGDYVDSEGHALKNNIAVLTLMKALTNV